MKIIVAQHRGFCYGVKRAVDMAQDCADTPGQAVTLGPIIHNPQMVQRLEAQGIGMAHTLEEIGGGTVIIRSHGVGPDTYKLAKEMGLRVVDATCPHVKKAQQAAKELAESGYQVVIIGEKKHPEVKSIFEWSGKKAYIIETKDEAEGISFHDKLGIVAQTTFASDGFQDIVDVLKTKTNDINIKRTICTATDLRQQAALEVAVQVDVMIVIGGRNSANTTHLAELCMQSGCRTYHIETAEELQPEWFAGSNLVGITAGASTPDWLIEEVYKKMEAMNEFMNESVKEIRVGSIIQGTVVGIRKEEVFVDVGYKAEGVIPLSELAYPIPEDAGHIVQVGDPIDVYVVEMDGQDGLKLSKVKADRVVAWNKLTAALEAKELVTGKVIEAVKGGLAVVVFGVRGFIPASQVDIRYTENLAQFVGPTFSLLTIEVDEQKQRAVFSRRLVLEEEKRQREQAIFSSIAVNDILTGKVTRIADFGAFVDIGGVDGLVHISDLSWERVKSPADVVSIGDEVTVVVTKLDPQARKISLSLKQVTRDPWLDRIEQFSPGTSVKGKVTKVAGFGAFVEIAKGIEGLVRLSELAERKVTKAEEVVSIGQEVNVKILEIDKENKRLALSIIKASQDAERAEYQEYLTKNTEVGLTLGDKFGHLFRHED
jgi:4-hydroxy-3-methylbut-2-enyl diphosphate reductase